MLLLRLADKGDRARVVVDRLLVAFAPAHDVAQRVERTNVRRLLLRQVLEQCLGLIDPIELIEIYGLANVDRRLKRRAARDAVVGGNRYVILLGVLVEGSQRSEGKREIGLQIGRHLQIDCAYADAAFTR